MNQLPVTKQETLWLIDRIGSMRYWPSRGHTDAHMMAAFLPVGEEVGGGMPLRLKLVATYRKFEGSNYRTIPLEVSLTDLWLIDEVLWSVQGDLRYNYIPEPDTTDGKPLMTLAKRVWDLLIQEHADKLPPYLRHSSPTDGEPIPDAKAKADEVLDEIMRKIEEAA